MACLLAWINFILNVMKVHAASGSVKTVGIGEYNVSRTYHSAGFPTDIYSHPLDSTSAARVVALPLPSPFSPLSKSTFADAAKLSKSIFPGGVGGTQASMSWKKQHRKT